MLLFVALFVEAGETHERWSFALHALRLSSVCVCVCGCVCVCADVRAFVDACVHSASRLKRVTFVLLPLYFSLLQQGRRAAATAGTECGLSIQLVSAEVADGVRSAHGRHRRGAAAAVFALPSQRFVWRAVWILWFGERESERERARERERGRVCERRKQDGDPSFCPLRSHTLSSSRLSASAIFPCSRADD